MSETVKFQTNVPEHLSLAFSQGKEVSSQFGGDQVMFSLDDGRRMYLSPFVAAKIYEANISAHTPFTLCKREVTHGNRRSIEWEIQTHNNPAGAPVKTTPAGLTHQATQALTRATPSANSNAYGDAPAWVNEPAPATVPPVTLDSNLVELMKAHMAAIDVAAMAERYAAEKGLAIRYTSEDVRCMAATIYIRQQETQKGGAR
jgi:hypothetical protein